MTSGRFWPCATVAFSLLAASGCSGEGPVPCSADTCPPIEGTYTLSFTDAGIANTGECGTVPATLPEGPLVITRRIAEISGTLQGGATLSGVAYNTREFNLTGTVLDRAAGGSGDTLTYSFTGSVILPRTTGGADAGTGSGADGGTAGDNLPQLTGNFNQTRTRASTSGGATQRCNVFRNFTATRQP